MATIPTNAERVFSGKIFDVYQWQQPLFDGSVTTFEVAKRTDSVVILATDGERILVEDEQQPGLPPVVTLPCGEVNRGESPRAAAERELLEETGYASDDWELLATEEIGSSKLAWTIHYYIARSVTKTTDPNPDAGEQITPRFVDFDEFVTLTKRPDFQNSFIALLIYRLTPPELTAFRARLFEARSSTASTT